MYIRIFTFLTIDYITEHYYFYCTIVRLPLSYIQGDHFLDHMKFPDFSLSVVSSPSGVRAEKQVLEYLELKKHTWIHFPWLFPDHFGIPWLFQVFQVSGHPDIKGYLTWLRTATGRRTASGQSCRDNLAVARGRKMTVGPGSAIRSSNLIHWIEQLHVRTF